MTALVRRARLVGLLAPLLFAGLSFAETWWDDGWTRRRKLTFANSTRGENLQSFPTLVALQSGRVDYGRTQNAGQDVRFVDSGGSTVLAHEIELWNEAGISYVWVRVPQIDAWSAADHVWMYYGNPSALDGQNAPAVWSAGYVGVWHLAGDLLDSTANGNDGTDGGSAAVAGRIAGGREFDGSSAYVSVSSSPSLQIASSISMSGWISGRSWGLGEYVNVIARKGGGNPNNYQLAVDESRATIFLNQADGQGYHGETVLGTYSWHHVAGVWDGSTVRVYLNGSPDNPSPFAGPGSIGTDLRDLYVGGRPANDCFDGVLDEVRISSVPRSADWVAAQYDSMTDVFVTYWPEESLSAGSLPPPWMHADVGSPGLAGDASYSNGAFAVSGNGGDIWGTSDSCHFVYQQVTGDCEIIARLVRQDTGLDPWAKAVITIRDDPDGHLHADAYHVTLTRNENTNVYMYYRSTATGGTSTAPYSIVGSPAPYWLRLVRSGDTFTSYTSPDPASSPWQVLGRLTVVLSPDLFVGMAVTSHDTPAFYTATFDNVTVLATPGAFSLLAPPGGAGGVALRPVLDWEESQNAQTYALLVDDAPDFSSPAVDVAGLGSSSYTVPARSLDVATTYYWKVTAASGTWSTTAANSGIRFTTVTELPPALDYLGGGCAESSLRARSAELRLQALFFLLPALLLPAARRRSAG